jgi:hypothetical protein
MANLYYNGAVDLTWNTTGNWWSNTGHSTPAGAIPANGDVVYIDAEMDTGPTVSVSPTSVYAGTIDTVNTNPVTLNSNVTCDAFFYNHFQNNGEIAGNCTFNNSSQNTSSGTVDDDATFNDTSQNNGNVGNNATFNGSSQNNGDVQESATFNDYSTCIGTVNDSEGYTATATFNDFSVCGPYANIQTDTYFNNSATLSYGVEIVGSANFLTPETLLLALPNIIEGNPTVTIPSFTSSGGGGGINGSSILGLL